MKSYQYRILNILMGLVVLAPFHWVIAYEQIDMISLTYFLYSILTAGIVGGLGVFFFKRRIIGSAGWTTLGFVIAIMIKVIWDVIQDPTSHNLFPFEILIISVYSFPASLLGARIAGYFTD
jgi:hypothetical protein